MRIGLNGGARSADAAVTLAEEAERDGFTSLWYPGAVGRDPLALMTVVGRATSSIELGTAVLQTYTCHPALQSNRVRAVADVVDRPVTLGVGPSHAVAVEALGLSYEGVGRHTEDYLVELRRHVDGTLPLLLAALGPRLLRVAGEQADGTILWMANARAVGDHVAPRITRAAERAGRNAPRIVAGLPVAVHDDVDEARAAGGEQFALYGTLPNYQRILAHGGISSPTDALVVGNEDAVRTQIEALFSAGATDVWAAIFPVGDDRAASQRRTRALLAELTG